MDLLNSSWLIHLINGGGKTPTDKILSTFTILDNWLKAPNVREGLPNQESSQDCFALKAHLLSLAIEGKFKNPEIVINQLLILLHGALAAEIGNPGMGAFPSAQLAAKAVLTRARPNLMIRMDNIIKRSGYAASFIAATILAVHFMPIGHQTQTQYVYSGLDRFPVTPVGTWDMSLVDKAFQLRKDMEAGTCPTPNFFSVPKEQLATYVSVVQFNLMDNAEVDNQKLANFLTWYDKNRAWECFSEAENKQKTILGMGV